jgi:hypothetical protein
MEASTVLAQLGYFNGNGTNGQKSLKTRFSNNKIPFSFKCKGENWVFYFKTQSTEYRVNLPFFCWIGAENISLVISLLIFMFS